MDVSQPPPIPYSEDNILTQNTSVMVAALVTRFEIDFAKLLITMIHKMDFKPSTTYLFSYMIFQLCREGSVPIWHRDSLRTPMGAVDFGLIWDNTNVAAQRCRPRVDLHSLSENMADTVDPATFEPTDTTPAESSLGTSREPSSSQSTTLSLALVPVARVQNLEA